MNTRRYAFGVAVVALLVGVFANGVLATGLWNYQDVEFYTTLSGNESAFRNTHIAATNSFFNLRGVTGRIAEPPLMSTPINVQGPTILYSGGYLDNKSDFESYLSDSEIRIFIMAEIRRWNGTIYVNDATGAAMTDSGSNPPKHVLFLSKDKAHGLTLPHEIYHLIDSGHHGDSNNFMHENATGSSSGMTDTQRNNLNALFLWGIPAVYDNL